MERVITARHVVLATLCMLACGLGLSAQSMHSAAGKATSKCIPRAQQPYNPITRDTTPFNHEQYRTHPRPNMVRYCQDIKNIALRSEGAPCYFGFNRYATGSGHRRSQAAGLRICGRQTMKPLLNCYGAIIRHG